METTDTLSRLSYVETSRMIYDKDSLPSDTSPALYKKREVFWACLNRGFLSFIFCFPSRLRLLPFLRFFCYRPFLVIFKQNFRNGVHVKTSRDLHNFIDRMLKIDIRGQADVFLLRKMWQRASMILRRWFWGQ